MCGRFSLTQSIEAICSRFNAMFEGDEEWHSRYNIAPAQEVLTVVADETGKKFVTPMLWGLIPSWSKDRKIGYKMINARAETLHEKPSYKKPFRRQRCLIPSDGFFEWKKQKTGKTPLRIILKSRELFAMAGLWDIWHDKENDKDIRSFSIVTTRANSKLEDIHDRMPAILLTENEDIWLDPGMEDVEALQKILGPYSSDEMEVYEVSSVVNSWKNDVEECIKPV